jgi:3-oxoacyl-[acyl-carrier-protein] synthase II
MLAASGIIELIATLLAMKHQTIPATLHTRPGQVALPIPLATTNTERPIRRAMKISTGFTGHDAALLFEAV